MNKYIETMITGKGTAGCGTIFTKEPNQDVRK